jgi:hypothetical protein
MKGNFKEMIEGLIIALGFLVIAVLLVGGAGELFKYLANCNNGDLIKVGEGNKIQYNGQVEDIQSRKSVRCDLIYRSYILCLESESSTAKNACVVHIGPLSQLCYSD